MEGLGDIAKKYVIVPGGAYRQLRQYPENEDAKLRFFFILNKAPENDDELVVVTSTTKIRKNLKYTWVDVLVIVTPQEYSPFTEKSIINCMFAEIKSKQELEKEIEQNKIRPEEPLPRSVLERCKKAIRAAPTPTEEMKRLVLGEEEATERPSSTSTTLDAE